MNLDSLKLKTPFFTLLLMTCWPIQNLQAQTFDEIWKRIEENSFGIKAAQAEKFAAEQQAHNSNMHWFPKLSLGAQMVSTNDPATTLFSTLGSRTIQAVDFVPSTMNSPNREWFKRGSATLDWALFEGGAQWALSKANKAKAQASDLNEQAKRREVYAETAQEYSQILSFVQSLQQLKEIRGRIGTLLANYRLGSRENPVGYSGLLGLKALSNRLDSEISQNEAEIENLRRSLQVRSNASSAVKVQEGEVIPFLDKNLPLSFQQNNLRAKANSNLAAAMEEASNAESARWLPRVGVFANENLVSAPRDTGTSTEFGLYLQWDLFNPRNLGLKSAARQLAEAADQNAKDHYQRSQIATDQLKTTIPLLRQNNSRLEESMKLTQEQMQMTEKLFRSGAINALQFSEVLSRRADLIQAKNKTELALIQAVASQYRQESL